MTELTLDANFDAPDDFYAALLKAHDGLTVEDMHALNARLILVLANHIGDQSVLEAAIKAATLDA
ncbi:DUF2783 domain-containing protein [Algirhabdus cladophorae]|uniref:DUF2783 domain-containing protein n=1 Tax=Algirhabdus cladophorae TaxID=3377108 RepID=UPI003B846704